MTPSSASARLYTFTRRVRKAAYCGRQRSTPLGVECPHRRQGHVSQETYALDHRHLRVDSHRLHFRRVERVLELAELVLNDPQRWNQQSIAHVLESGATTNVTLAKKMPVLLTYWTAWVDPQGRTNFRHDIYGQDARWSQALDAEFKLRKKPLFETE